MYEIEHWIPRLPVVPKNLTVAGAAARRVGGYVTVGFWDMLAGRAAACIGLGNVCGMVYATVCIVSTHTNRG